MTFGSKRTSRSCAEGTAATSHRPKPRVRQLRRVPFALIIATAASCGGSKHEALGDRAYVQAAFSQALAEYRLALAADSTPSLHAKAAFAALNAEELVIAAEEFSALAQSNSDRTTEAADGLERVAREAARVGNSTALQAALSGLQTIAESRAIGSFARELANDFDGSSPTAEALDVLAYAAAGAPDVEQQDSLMFEYGSVLRRMGRCEPAYHVFASLLRRERDLSDQRQERQLAGGCALRLGQVMLDRRMHQDAVTWYQRAADADPGGPIGRSALVGLGDAYVALGEFDKALDAYRRAGDGLDQSDSLSVVVQRRINTIFDANRVFR